MSLMIGGVLIEGSVDYTKHLIWTGTSVIITIGVSPLCG